MTEENLRSHYHEVDRIVEEVLPNVKAMETQARYAVQKPPQLDPPGTPWFPSTEQIADMYAYYAEADAFRDQASNRIEREVIADLPPNATPEDRAAIRTRAYDRLEIPRDAPERSLANLQGPARLEGLRAPETPSPPMSPERRGIPEQGMLRNEFAEKAGAAPTAQAPATEDARRAKLLAALESREASPARDPGGERGRTIETAAPDAQGASAREASKPSKTAMLQKDLGDNVRDITAARGLSGEEGRRGELLATLAARPYTPGRVVGMDHEPEAPAHERDGPEYEDD